MTGNSELDEALEQVITAAREHLAAVKAAGGEIDDERVWRSYVALNNTSYTYDQLLLDEFGEVTPWETEAIDIQAAEADARFFTGTPGEPADDPYPSVVSVRQRRDYRVPSVSALLRAAEVSARRISLEGEAETPSTVAEAVLELVQGGDGSLGTLDVPELEPLEGVVTVTEVTDPLNLDQVADSGGTHLFQLGPDDRLVGRLDEHPYLDSEPDDE